MKIYAGKRVKTPNYANGVFFNSFDCDLLSNRGVLSVGSSKAEILVFYLKWKSIAIEKLNCAFGWEMQRFSPLEVLILATANANFVRPALSELYLPERLCLPKTRVYI